MHYSSINMYLYHLDPTRIHVKRFKIDNIRRGAFTMKIYAYFYTIYGFEAVKVTIDTLWRIINGS